MRKVIGFWILAAFISCSAAEAQIHVPDSCLVLWQYSPLKPKNVAWKNDDSVMVDLCDPYGVTNTEYPEFAKKKYWIDFQYYIIPDTLAPIGDSLGHDWRIIDAKYSDLRNAFDSLEKLFGAFTIHHLTEENLGYAFGDTLQALKDWEVDFNNYQNIDSVLFYLKQFPEVHIINNTIADVNFGGYPLFFEDVVNPNQTILKLWPQPCNKEIFIQSEEPIGNIALFDPLGRKIEVLVSSIADNQASVDVSKMRDGFYFFYISHHFFKVLIQK